MQKKITKWTAAVVVILALSFLAEILIFNRTALFHSYDALEFSEGLGTQVTDTLAQLSSEEQEAIRVEQENKKLLAEYRGEEYVEEPDASLVEQDGRLYRKVKQTEITIDLQEHYYIKKLKLMIPMEENGGYTVSVYENGQMTADGMYCSINPKLDAGIANIGKNADEVRIILLTEEEPQLADLKVEISNRFSLNAVRIAFFAVSFLSLFLILGAGRGVWVEMREKPQWFLPCLPCCLADF